MLTDYLTVIVLYIVVYNVMILITLCFYYFLHYFALKSSWVEKLNSIVGCAKRVILLFFSSCYYKILLEYCLYRTNKCKFVNLEQQSWKFEISLV